jgi:hypothetical protein
VVAAAGIAAALVIGAARAGTKATGRALEQFADEMEGYAKAQDDREIQSRLWGLAACAVVEANQELLLLAERAKKTGVRVPLPSPFDLTGHGLADTRAWVVQTQQTLISCRAQIEQAEADRERQALFAKLPAPADPEITAADLLADFAATLADRHRKSRRDQRTATVAPAPDRRATRTSPMPQRPRTASPIHDEAVAQPKADKVRVRAEINEVLARLDLDATAAERQEAVLAAAHAARQDDIGISHTYLNALTRKVDEVINPRAARRREAAGMLAALEHPVVVEAIADATPLPPHLRSIERLRAVVRGDADLTDEDRRDAGKSLAWAQKQVERRRLLDAMTETFAGLGYSVTTGMRVGYTAGLCVAREAWRGGHNANVWIDEAGNVQWRLVELAANAGAETSRCEDINRSMRVVGETLAQRGFDVTVEVPEILVKPEAAHDQRAKPVVKREDESQPAQKSIDPTEDR